MHMQANKMDIKPNLALNSKDCSLTTDFGGEKQLLRNQYNSLSKGDICATTVKNSVKSEEKQSMGNKEPSDQPALPSICIETPDRHGKPTVLNSDSPASQASWSPSMSDCSPQDKLKSLEDFQHFSLGVSVSNNKYFSPLKKRYGAKAKEQADHLQCKKLEKSEIESTPSKKEELVAINASTSGDCTIKIEVDISQDDSDASSTSISSVNTPIKKRGKQFAAQKSNTKRQLFLEEDEDEEMGDQSEHLFVFEQKAIIQEDGDSKYRKTFQKGNTDETMSQYGNRSPTVVDADTSSETEDVIGSSADEGDSEEELDDEELSSPSKRRKSMQGSSVSTKSNRQDKKRKVKPVIKKSPNNGKVYDSVKGTTCHQCKQKTMDKKTVCARCSNNCSNSTIRGCYCGSCLLNRYGENIDTVLKNQQWICPICRDCCNCSSCRRRMGKNPVSITTREALKKGYESVFQMLEKEKHKYQ